jgi:hypothetical protein
MKEKKPFVIFMFLFIFCIYIILFMILYNTFFSKNNNAPLVNSDNLSTWTVEITDVILPLTWEIRTWEISSWLNSMFVISQDCKIIQTWTYKIIEIFDKEMYSPVNGNYINFTNKFKVSWKIEEAYGCLVADVVDYRKTHKKYYTTYILFWNAPYEWHLNVGRSKDNNVMYDNSTSSLYEKKYNLNWRFRGDESPKIYTTKEFNLSNLIVADRENWGTKAIKPIDKLNEWGIMSIGAFVNTENWEWIIKKFLLIYKWGEIVKV